MFTVAGWFISAAFLAGSMLGFNLFGPSAMVRGLSFIRIVARYLERIAGHAATLHLLADLRVAVFAKVMTFKPARLATLREGDLVARLTADVDTLDGLFLQILAPVLTASLAALLFGLLLGAYSSAVALGFSLVVLISAWALPWWLARTAGSSGAQLQNAAAALRTVIHQSLGAHTDIVAFGSQEQARAQLRSACARLAASSAQVAATGAWAQVLQQLLFAVALLVLVLGGYQAFNAGALSGPLWVGLILGGMGLFEVIGPLMRAATKAGALNESAHRIAELFASPAAPPLKTGIALPPTGDFVLQDVAFRYAPGPWLFKHLNLRIAAGEKLAITGASGAGKSSLLSLLMKINEPSHGVISYAGVALSDVDDAAIHQRVAMLTQFSPVFMGTIRDNLCIGKPNASDEQLWCALRSAQLDEFVQQLEHGLDTWLGESGQHISLGQARRVCLARIFLADAQVWVLDEPTAGLDQATAQAFFKDLLHIAGTRTVVVVTHAQFAPRLFERVINL